MDNQIIPNSGGRHFFGVPTHIINNKLYFNQDSNHPQVYNTINYDVEGQVIVARL